jgi:hypothetical protein
MSARRLLFSLLWLVSVSACGSETPSPGDVTTVSDVGDVSPQDTQETDSLTDAGETDSAEADAGETDTVEADTQNTDSVDAGEPDVPTDTGPTLPFTVSDEVEPVFAETLDPTPTDWLALSHTGDDVLAGNADSIWRLAGEEVQELELDELFTADTVTAAVGLPDGRFLIAAAGGLYLADGAEVVASPLGELFTDETMLEILAFEVKGSLVLWFAATDGIHTWKDQMLHTITPDGLATQGAHMALAPSGHLWVAADKDVYWLEEAGDSLEAWSEQDSLEAQELQTDKMGYVWVESAGALSLRTPDATWFDLAELAPTSVVATYKSEHVWFGSDDALWHLHDAVLRPTDGPNSAIASQTDNQGRLVMATAEGIIRVNPGRSVELDGLPGSGVLASETTLSILPDSPDLVTEVNALVDGVALTLDEAWSFTLDPHALGEGNFAVEVTVTYSDVAVTSQATFPFEVILPTWKDDIEPLAAANCFGCHGDKAALDLKLYTKDDWQSKFSLVVFKTNGDETYPATMPPGDPLSLEKQELIKLWGEAGFL